MDRIKKELSKDTIVITVPHAVCTNSETQEKLKKIFPAVDKKQKKDVFFSRAFGFDCDVGSLPIAYQLQQILITKGYKVELIIPEEGELQHFCKVVDESKEITEEIASSKCDLNTYESRKLKYGNDEYGNAKYGPALYRKRLTQYLTQYKEQIKLVIDIHSFPSFDINSMDIILIDDKTTETKKKRGPFKKKFEDYSIELFKELKNTKVSVKLQQGNGNDIMDEVKNNFRIPCILINYNEYVLDSTLLKKGQSVIDDNKNWLINRINDGIINWIRKMK